MLSEVFTMDDCIFCKLANGIFPTSTVYEDEDFRAILDIAPANKGHVIILPKTHAKDIFELDETVASKLLPVAKKVAAAVKKATGCDGVNLLQNNGTAAGQSVFHLHVHVIPRFKDDGILPVWEQHSYSEGEADIMAEKINQSIL